jgi:hypothetical protein
LRVDVNAGDPSYPIWIPLDTVLSGWCPTIPVKGRSGPVGLGVPEVVGDLYVPPSFKDGKYTVETPRKGQFILLTRHHTDTKGQTGEYWHTLHFSSPRQIRERLSVPSDLNTLDLASRILVPHGIRMYVGSAAPWQGLTGGAKQIWLPRGVVSALLEATAEAFYRPDIFRRPMWAYRTILDRFYTDCFRVQDSIQQGFQIRREQIIQCRRIQAALDGINAKEASARQKFATLSYEKEGQLFADLESLAAREIAWACDAHIADRPDIAPILKELRRKREQCKQTKWECAGKAEELIEWKRTHPPSPEVLQTGNRIRFLGAQVKRVLNLAAKGPINVQDLADLDLNKTYLIHSELAEDGKVRNVRIQFVFSHIEQRPKMTIYWYRIEPYWE